jgi:hypothetical protein
MTLQFEMFLFPRGTPAMRRVTAVVFVVLTVAVSILQAVRFSQLLVWSLLCCRTVKYQRLDRPFGMLDFVMKLLQHFAHRQHQQD